MSSKDRKARFLVERERTKFLNHRLRHVGATNGFALRLCNRENVTKIKHTQERTVLRNWEIKCKRAALYCASRGMF